MIYEKSTTGKQPQKMNRGEMRQKMKILAIDDEKIALEGLIDAISEAEPDAEVYGFRKASEALDFYEKNGGEIVFLDIQLRNTNGVTLAKQMKLLNPRVNIIFSTGYGDYREEAFDLHASGYLMKPITASKVRKELDYLRYPVEEPKPGHVVIRTFGNFEIYAGGKAVTFKYNKTKEMLAYLVDRNGTYCQNAEIMAALWQDSCHASYLRSLKKDLFDTLKAYQCENLVVSTRGSLRICPEEASCDYFDWCKGKVSAINQYRGEYMTQYSWAEFTNGELNRNREN